jgi:hypothetical protein
MTNCFRTKTVRTKTYGKKDLRTYSYWYGKLFSNKNCSDKNCSDKNLLGGDDKFFSPVLVFVTLLASAQVLGHLGKN